MKSKVDVGVIGVGLMGKTHATNLVTRIPQANLIGIADLNLPLAQNVASDLGVTNVYGDYRQLLKNELVDAIIVATPSFAKPELITDILESGKNVYCEKPLCVTIEDANNLAWLAEKTKVVFQSGESSAGMGWRRA